LVLSSIFVGLLVIYVLVVPYRRWEFSINRQSGKWSSTVVWYGVVRTQQPVSNATWSDPAIPAMFTADAREIPMGLRFQRFPWSDMSLLRPERGAWHAEAFFQMFYAMGLPKVTLTQEQREALIRTRIPRWNSNELDRDPQAVVEEIRAENRRILGRDTPYAVIP